MILSLLVTTSKAVNCYTSQNLNNGTEKMTKKKGQITTLIEIMQTTETNTGKLAYLLGEGSFGKVFYLPSQPKLAFKVVQTKNDIDDIKKEIQTAQEISVLDKSLVDLRLAPHFTSVFCYMSSSRTATFYIVGERFLGTMESAAEHANDFSYRMKNMAYRMRFYHKMILIFSVMYTNGYKHCDIKPENIFYGIKGMFEEEMEDNEEIDQMNNDAEYFPVMADFGLTVKTDEICQGGTPSYYEPNEIKGEMPSTNNYRARIEMFSLALSVFEIEGLFFYKRFIRGNLIDKDNWVPSWVGQINVPPVIQNDIDTIYQGGPCYSLKILMRLTLKRVGKFNVTKGFVYSFNDLQNEMAFYADVLMHYNQLSNADKMEMVTLPDSNKLVSVFTQSNEIYRQILNILLGMVKDNVMFVGRPSLDTVLQGFNDAAVNSTLLDQLAKQKVMDMFTNRQEGGFAKLKIFDKTSNKYLI